MAPITIGETLDKMVNAKQKSQPKIDFFRGLERPPSPMAIGTANDSKRRRKLLQTCLANASISFSNCYFSSNHVSRDPNEPKWSIGRNGKRHVHACTFDGNQTDEIVGGLERERNAVLKVFG
jgi:hypothetical protein